MRRNIKSTLSRGIQSIVLLAITGLLFFISSCSPSGMTMITRQSYHVDDRSWEEDTLRGYIRIPDSRVLVRSMFDEDSIYIEIRTRDSLSIRSMLTNGASIWIDPSAKQNQRFGIAIPAARAEMMRRQEEILQEMREQGDTVRRIPFDFAFWTQVVNERQAVITDARGTRFAPEHQARIYLDNNGFLVYDIRFSFSQLGMEKEETERFSVGIISEPQQLMAAAPQQQMGGPPMDRNRRTSPQARPAERRPERLVFIPVRGWIAFTLGEKPISENIE